MDSFCFTKLRLFLPLQDDYFRTWSPGKPFDPGKILFLGTRVGLYLCNYINLSNYICALVLEY